MLTDVNNILNVIVRVKRPGKTSRLIYVHLILFLSAKLIQFVKFRKLFVKTEEDSIIL